MVYKYPDFKGFTQELPSVTRRLAVSDGPCDRL